MEVYSLKEIILIVLLLIGTTYYGDFDESVIILANSIDRELNSDFLDVLNAEMTVTLVNAEEFEQYKTTPYILILGGHKTPEGVGEIIEGELHQQEKEEIVGGTSMIVKLNLWREGQVVAILAGTDREQTKIACQEHTSCYCTLLKAVQVVRENLISPDHTTMAFLWPHILSSTDKLAPYLPHYSPTTGHSVNTCSLKERSWFFWCDDLPFAKYAHPVRFVLFDIESGTHTIYNEEWWPVLNGISLWAAENEYWNRGYWVHNPGLTQSTPRIHIHTFSAKITVPVASPDKALVINGWTQGEFCKKDMEEDQGAMAAILGRMEFTVEKTNTLKSMQQTLEIWARMMQPLDTLVLYITAHGGEDYLLISGNPLTMQELRELLDGFDNRVHIGIIIDSCFSGRFLSDDIKAQTAFIITSTSRDGYAFGDWDPENDVNPGDKGSEFTSGLVESFAVYFPETGEHPLSPKDVYGRIFGTIEEILMDVFNGATEKDAAHQHGYSIPQIWMQGLEKMPFEEGGHGGYQ